MDMKRRCFAWLTRLNCCRWLQGSNEETAVKPWAWSQLTKHLSPSSSPPPSRLAQLPVELLLLILTELPPESVVAVSLTCKGLFQFKSGVVDGKADVAADRDALDKQRLLLLLERDLPDYLLCYACNKLYRWKTDRIAIHSLRYTCPARNRDSSHPHPAKLCGGCLNGSTIHRETRDLILRAHLRGADYGIPDSYVTHECVSSERFNSLQPQISVKLRPKIVSGSLMLWRTEEIAVNLSVSLTEQLRVLRECACRHLSSSIPAIGQCAIQHIQDDNTHRALSKPASGWKCQELFRCSFCATDFRIHVASTSREELSIQVASWQDLGSGPDCNSAQDQLFKYYPRQLHADDARTRNLEQLYRNGSQLVAMRASDAGDEPQANPVAQDYRWHSQREYAHLNKLPDF